MTKNTAMKYKIWNIRWVIKSKKWKWICMYMQKKINPKNFFQFGKKIFTNLGLICKLYNNMNFKIDISPWKDRSCWNGRRLNIRSTHSSLTNISTKNTPTYAVQCATQWDQNIYQILFIFNFINQRWKFWKIFWDTIDGWNQIHKTVFFSWNSVVISKRFWAHCEVQPTS